MAEGAAREVGEGVSWKRSGTVGSAGRGSLSITLHFLQRLSYCTALHTAAALAHPNDISALAHVLQTHLQPRIFDDEREEGLSRIDNDVLLTCSSEAWEEHRAGAVPGQPSLRPEPRAHTAVALRRAMMYRIKFEKTVIAQQPNVNVRANR